MENQKDMQTRLVPGVGRMPYPAYRGKEHYVFISYDATEAPYCY